MRMSFNSRWFNRSLSFLNWCLKSKTTINYRYVIINCFRYSSYCYIEFLYFQFSVNFINTSVCSITSNNIELINSIFNQSFNYFCTIKSTSTCSYESTSLLFYLSNIVWQQSYPCFRFIYTFIPISSPIYLIYSITIE